MLEKGGRKVDSKLEAVVQPSATSKSPYGPAAAARSQMGQASRGQNEFGEGNMRVSREAAGTAAVRRGRFLVIKLFIRRGFLSKMNRERVGGVPESYFPLKLLRRWPAQPAKW